MKIAYRIVTPILAIGALVMGILLKLFYFAIGGASDEITSIITLASQFGVATKYEFSVYEIIELLLGSDLSAAAQATEEAAEEVVTFASVAEPVIPHLIAFVVFFVLTLVMLFAIAIVSAVVGGKKGRKTVIGMSAGGLVLCFICIVISRFAFDIIIGGEISLTDLVSLFSESAWTQILTAVVTISSATLSAGFYGVFGMYIVIILWTVLTNMLIKTPIQFQKKHRRKKPMKKLSAYFR